MKPVLLFFSPFIILLNACNGNSDHKEAKNKIDSVVVKKTPPKTLPPEDIAKKPPIINIVDTIATKRIVVCMKDSAANYDRIAVKLARIYGAKLAEIFKMYKLKPAGAPMAWFKNQKAPYFFEAGIPVNKRPVKLPKGFFIRETNADSIVLAHFYGPYDIIPQGYSAVKDWMKETGRYAGGRPYEIYISDPFDKKGKPVNPYKVRTDIVFPRR